MNPFVTSLLGAGTRILLWTVSGALIALGASPEVQEQVTQFVGDNPTNAALATTVFAIVWYGKAKLTKGET